MRNLADELDELLSRAKYFEERQANTPMTPDYWTRLKAACDEARTICPDVLKNVAPDESNQTWAEGLLCLEAIAEALRDCKTS